MTNLNDFRLSNVQDKIRKIAFDNNIIVLPTNNAESATPISPLNNNTNTSISPLNNNTNTSISSLDNNNNFVPMPSIEGAELSETNNFSARDFASDALEEAVLRYMNAGKIEVDPNDPALYTAYTASTAAIFLKDTLLAAFNVL